MKRGLRDLESVRRLLAFVNGSVESESAEAHERARALMNLLAEVSEEKWQHPTPWDAEMRAASANRLGEMRWYSERVLRALDLGEQFDEEEALIEQRPLETTGPQPMREAVQLLIVNTFYSHVLVMRCAWAECGNFTIEDRNVRDARRHRRYCSPECQKAADNDKRNKGGYWKENKKCVREVNDKKASEGSSG